MELTRAIRLRRTIIVNITQESATAITYNLGSLPLNSPIIQGLEKGSDLVLFLEPEFGGVDERERKGSFVAGLEVEIRREEVVGVEV